MTSISPTRKNITKLGLVVFGLALLIATTGCLSNYGRVKSKAAITDAFENNQVPQNFKYYYFGRSNMPYVIIGLDPNYNLRSRIWREVDPNSEAFESMVYWTWSETYYHSYGARGSEILDPQGKKIGIWYSSVRWAAVKMLDDQGGVMIAPDMPWMLGTR